MRSRIVREGSVGLFALFGLILLSGLVVWLRGGGINRESYQIIVSFEDVSGLQLGAPVNYRGVTVGRIVRLTPSSNSVNVTLEIDSVKLRIPRDVRIEANRYGLIGEASVDITPLATLSEEALAINPRSEECEDKQLILCDQTQMIGKSGDELVNSLTQLSQAYSDPQFIANINATARNAAIAGEKIAKLTDEMTLLAKTTRQEIQGVSETVEAIKGTANKSSILVENIDKTVINNQNDLKRSLNQASALMENLNITVAENRQTVQRTLLSLEKTSNDLQKLASNLDTVINQVNTGLNAVNTAEVAQNLDKILRETAQTSANLRQLSDTLNDPANIAAILQTLDSARASFENMQKITADIEEFTGDPVLRQNLRKMIDGLGELLSSTEQLEQKVITLQNLQTNPVSPRLTPYTPENHLSPIDPQTSRYQLLPPRRLDNRRFLSQKEEEQRKVEEK